ncbi:DUF956 family protein, partial [Listeria monocytogenes]|uniref:DUF956 family protein n=1 Tax=Listeria monocytogenes TaxID=1639 RepID=UPI00113FED58
IKTKRNGTYTFASKRPKEVLRKIRVSVDPATMVSSLSFFDVMKRSFRSIFSKKKNKNK